MVTKHWCLVVVCSFLSGCGAYAWEPMHVGTTRPHGMRHVPVIPPREVAPPTPGSIAGVLLLEGSAERPCEVLGVIDQHTTMGHEAEALERLRADAARMGADAVIHVEFEHSEESADGRGDEQLEGETDLDAATDEGVADARALHLSGTAVRFRDLIGGRRYEILGRIEVSEGMAREEEALASLRRRARALHADLVIGVAFHHGDGAGGVGVEGTAIRFVP